MSTRIPSEELMDLLALARKAGRNVTILPAMTGAELEAVELQTNSLLPLAIRDLFGMVGGFTVDGFAVDFHSNAPINVLAFRNALPIASDADGAWIIDHDEGGWHPVLYVSRRPPVVIIQASTLTTFIAQSFAPGGPRHLVGPLLHEIAKKNPYAIPRRSFLHSRDKVLAAFATELDDAYFMTDLRGKRAGVGFVWRPNASLRRTPGALVFGVSKTASLLSWLFGPS